MNWDDERYVRLYTRDTPSWFMIPWESRAVLPNLMRKLDRAGVLELDKHGIAGLAALLLLPTAVVEAGIDGLLKDGCLVRNGDVLCMPNFRAAQEVGHSDRVRQRESRERRRTTALSRDVTTVTDSHVASQQVTECHPMPYRAVPSRTQLKECAAEAPPPPSGEFVLESPGTVEDIRGARERKLENEARGVAERVIAKLNRDGGRCFEVGPAVPLIVKLLRRKHTETQMKLVVWHAIRLRDEGKYDGLYVRPVTLLKVGERSERSFALRAAEALEAWKAAGGPSLEGDGAA